MPISPSVVDAFNNAAVVQTLQEISAAYDAIDENVDEEVVVPYPGLLGIRPEVFRQINGAIRAGKRHFLIYGPPGTGKTTLAQLLAESLGEPAAEQKWKLITGSSDWTSQEIIGGYQPAGAGRIRFTPGVLLENLNKVLIVDELNRCDIDKVIGPLFTVLSGQSTTLPYLADTEHPERGRISIHPVPTPGLVQNQEFAPSHHWRLIATLNSIDKASLYQMSYALTRRFAWIFVDVPSDLNEFIWDFGRQKNWIANGARPASLYLGEVWAAVNAVRPMGPAPFIDIMQFLFGSDNAFDFVVPLVANDPRSTMMLDALYTFIYPMLDGITRQEAVTLSNTLATILVIQNEPVARTLAERLGSLSI